MTWVQFRTGAKAHLSWLFVRPLWFWAGMLSFALAIWACWTFKTEPAVRITGLALELLGLGTALWGLEKTRKDFGRPSLAALFKAWCAARPRRRSDVLKAESGSFETTGGAARFDIWNPIDPTASLPQQFAAMCKNVDRLRSDLNRLTDGHDALSSQVTDRLKTEAAARGELEHELRRDLERTMTDGLLVSLIGLAWILVGTLLTTLSGEISCFLSP